MILNRKVKKIHEMETKDNKREIKNRESMLLGYERKLRIIGKGGK
jgi:hypothetical protein